MLEPVPEWIHDDGVRSLEDPWEYNEALFTTLKQLDIPYVVIGQEKKDILARVGFVMERLRLSGSASTSSPLCGSYGETLISPRASVATQKFSHRNNS